MKAEVVREPLGDSSLMKVTGDDGLYKGLYLDDAELLAIHAALTEWKAKREEKPKEPTWRAWTDATEIPAEAVWLQSETCRPGERFAITAVTAPLGNVKLETAGRRNDPITADELFRLWKWSPDGVTWHRCGVLE